MGDGERTFWNCACVRKLLFTAMPPGSVGIAFGTAIDSHWLSSSYRRATGSSSPTPSGGEVAVAGDGTGWLEILDFLEILEVLDFLGVLVVLDFLDWLGFVGFVGWGDLWGGGI